MKVEIYFFIAAISGFLKSTYVAASDARDRNYFCTVKVATVSSSNFCSPRIGDTLKLNLKNPSQINLKFHTPTPRCSDLGPSPGEFKVLQDERQDDYNTNGYIRLESEFTILGSSQRRLTLDTNVKNQSDVFQNIQVWIQDEVTYNDLPPFEKTFDHWILNCKKI